MRPVGVAKLIAARHAEKRHVDIQLAVLKQLHAPAMGVNLHRLVHQPVGDGIRQPAAHARGVNPGDNAAFNMLDQRVVAGHQRAGGQRQVFEAHPRQQRHDGVDHPVAFAKRMVEGDGHPVLQAAALNRLFNRGAELAAVFRVAVRQPRRGAVGGIKGLQVPQMGKIHVKKFCLIHHLILTDARRRPPRAPAPPARG